MSRKASYPAGKPLLRAGSETGAPTRSVRVLLGFPITRLSLAVPFGFGFALDGAATELAVVFGDELVPVGVLAAHLEGDVFAP